MKNHQQNIVLDCLRRAFAECDLALGDSPDGSVKRELALAKTAIEDASMRVSRATTIAAGLAVFPAPRVRPQAEFIG